MKNAAVKIINEILKEDPKGEALIYSQQCENVEHHANLGGTLKYFDFSLWPLSILTFLKLILKLNYYLWTH